jgi:hypothetical protein
MFGRREYVPYEKSIVVTENRAPSDDSVRLLNEMQEKAEANIIGRMQLTNNGIEAEVTVHRDSERMDSVLRVVAKVNGALVKADVRISGTNVSAGISDDAATKLRDAFAKELAATVLAVPFERAARQMRIGAGF